MYVPRRDHRFEYIWDAMNFIEETQCKRCVFSKMQDPDEARDHATEYPMCYPIEGKFCLEEPVDEIDDLGDEGLRCTLFQEA